MPRPPSRRWRLSRNRLRRIGQSAPLKFRTCRLTRAGRGGRDANVEHHHFGAKRNYAFDPKQHSNWAKRLARWISRRRQSCRARGFGFEKRLARMERALGQFMPRCGIRASMVHGSESAAAGAGPGDVRNCTTTKIPDDQFSVKQD